MLLPEIWALGMVEEKRDAQTPTNVFPVTTAGSPVPSIANPNRFKPPPSGVPQLLPGAMLAPK
jgi:hypothetical protein